MKIRLTARAYVFVIALSALTVATAPVLLLNAVIDPYGMFYLVEAPWNACKPEAQNRLDLLKAYGLRHHKPDQIALGTSRVLAGIATDSPFWGQESAYNLGLPGASMDKMLAYLMHADEQRPLRRVVFGLDFFVFNEKNPQNLEYDAPFLATHDNSFGWLRESLRIGLSAATITDSLATLEFNRREKAICAITPTGYRHPGFGLIEYSLRASVEQHFWRNVAGYAAGRSTRGGDAQTVLARGGADKQFEKFATLLRYCHTRGIDLRVYIPPVHAIQSETIVACGLWEVFELWKRQVVRLNEDIAGETGADPFPVTDFSGYNRYTSEPFPAPDTPQYMTYYWDCSHYKVPLGEEVLRVVLGNEANVEFGRPLDSGTIDTVLAEIRAERSAWLENHREISDQLWSMSAGARTNNTKSDTSRFR